MSVNLQELQVIIKSYIETYPNTTSEVLASYIKNDNQKIKLSLKDLRAEIFQVRRKKSVVNRIPKMVDNSPLGFFSINLGCYHFPFHDKNQWEATVHLIHWMGQRFITDLNLVGDMMDMNSISRHNKGKKAKVAGLTLTKEYQEGNLELDKIQGATLRNRRYFYGNHENWYFVHMSEIDNAKLGEGVIKSPREALSLATRGYEVYQDYIKDRILIGNMILTHGSFFNTHAAQKHVEAYKQNILFFHTHRMQQFTDSGQNGTVTGYNGGCGVDRWSQAFNYADQATRLKWEQGLTITYTDELGHTHADMIHWKNERFVYMGHEFTKDGVKSLFKD